MTAQTVTLNAGTGGAAALFDSVTTVDGVAAPASATAQMVKPAFGAQGSARNVSAQFPFPVDVDSKRTVTFKGRASTFRIPGRAGITGQKILSLHNATGSTVLVDVHKVAVDLSMTVIKAVTVIPPIIRMYKVTVLPSNGTALAKVARDSALSSSASVTVLQDASADGTSSATALTATLPAGAVITQEYAPRIITAAGIEFFDRTTFLDGDSSVTLRALEGVVMMLDYTLATANPTTDMWLASIEWDEYTLAV